MWDLLRKINQAGTTIILTTHYLEEAENLCRSIAIINHGLIIEHNSMDNVLARMHVNRYFLDTDEPIVNVPVLPEFSLEYVDSRTLAAKVPTALGIHALLNALGERGIRVLAIRNASNRLEQLFLDMLERPA